MQPTDARSATGIASCEERDHVKFLLSISRGIDDVTTLIGKVTWWTSLAMVAVGVLNVFTRYVGRNMGISLGGTLYIVLQTYAYNVIFLLGASYVFHKDAHVRVDIVFSNLSRRARAWVDVVGIVLFLLPFCLMGLYFAEQYIANSWRQNEVNLNAGGIAVYPIKTVIAVAFSLLVAQGISELIKHVAFLRGHPWSGSIHAPPPDPPDEDGGGGIDRSVPVVSREVDARGGA